MVTARPSSAEVAFVFTHKQCGAIDIFQQIQLQLQIKIQMQTQIQMQLQIQIQVQGRPGPS